MKIRNIIALALMASVTALSAIGCSEKTTGTVSTDGSTSMEKVIALSASLSWNRTRA